MNDEFPPQLFEIVHRVLYDNCPEKVDLVFLHGETRDNEDSSLTAGAKYYMRGFFPKIGITWADKSIFDLWIEKYEQANPELAERIKTNIKPDERGAIVGYPGFVHWKKRLMELNVNEEDIILIEPDYNCYFSTDAEARGLVKFCIHQGINNVCITAPPFHQIRAFISGVSALIDLNATSLNLYNCPGNSVDWNEEVVHSQGKVKGKRRELIKGELERILKYQKSGNPPLVSFDRVIEYLNQRASN